MCPVTGTSVAVERLIAANCQNGHQLNFRNVSENKFFQCFINYSIIIRAKHGLQLV